MSTPDIDIAHDGAVTRIRFNRPAKRNALTVAMYDAMADALTAAETMVGLHGRAAHALPHDLLTNVMHRYRPAR